MAAGCSGGGGSGDGNDPPPRDYAPPAHVQVRPLFFVPSDQAQPSPQQIADLTAHAEWSQTRFGELLGGVTFDIAGAPEVVAGALTLAEYRALPEEGVPAMTAELLARDGVTRWNNPWIYLAIVMDPVYSGGGRPLNGGFQGGGAITVISSAAFDAANFQSTLQHELGHTFGLPHVDVYGYSMTGSMSLMSYNEDHWTNGFDASATPGVLLAEDLRGLAWNDVALPGATFGGASPIAPPVCLGAMDLPGLPTNRISVITPSGQLFGSSVANVVQGTRIAPNEGPGVTFDASTMWQSDDADVDGAIVSLVFPVEVTLDAVAIHTQHSGLYNEAVAATVVVSDAGDLDEVASESGIAPDALLEFAPATSNAWLVILEPGASKQVTVRGLRFFSDGIEVFPFCVPYGG